MKNRGSRIFLYVQHLLGVGHLIRAHRVCRALAAEGFDVLIVTGGTHTGIIDIEGIRQLALPPIAIQNGDFSKVLNAEGAPIDEAYKDKRRVALLDAYVHFEPHVVIIEAFPFGRRIVEFELLPLIESIEQTQPKPLLLCSLRDILQRRTKPGRDQQTADRINQFFDGVLVHGDPAFYGLGESFSCAEQIKDKLLYTGLVSEKYDSVHGDSYDVVVSAGGGAVGAKLMKTCLAVQQKLPQSLRWLMVTGPNLSEELSEALKQYASSNLIVKRFVKQLPATLNNSVLSISQAGYNTVVDVLNAGCKVIVVPYSAHGETEQLDRAEGLQKLGLASVITENDLNVQVLENSISNLLGNTRVLPPCNIKLDGAEETVRIIDRLISDQNDLEKA